MKFLNQPVNPRAKGIIRVGLGRWFRNLSVINFLDRAIPIRRQLFLVIHALILSCFLPGVSSASVLSDAAAAMKPGEWKVLNTPEPAGMQAAFQGTNGASGFIFGFATEIRWDPHGRRAHYIGMDHSCCANSRQTTHVAYDE